MPSQIASLQPLVETWKFFLKGNVSREIRIHGIILLCNIAYPKMSRCYWIFLCIDLEGSTDQASANIEDLQLSPCQ